MTLSCLVQGTKFTQKSISTERVYCLKALSKKSAKNCRHSSLHTASLSLRICFLSLMFDATSSAYATLQLLEYSDTVLFRYGTVR